VAERLGRFLSDLHAVLPEILGLRAMSAADVADAFDAELVSMREVVFPMLDAETRQRLGVRFDAYLVDPANRRFAPITHGDVGPEHVLVAPGGDLAGVLDWEELAIGDPVADLTWLLRSRRTTPNACSPRTAARQTWRSASGRRSGSC
jgi:aminoglycoside phosphotransferase (APT) family kinase protein